MPTWQSVSPGRGIWNFTKSCWQLYCESCSAANVRKIQLAKINYSFSSECWMQGLQLHISAVFMLLCSSVLVMSDNKKPMDKLLIATTDNFIMKYLTSFYQWKIVFLSCKVKIIFILFVKSNTFYEQTAITLPANAQPEIAYFKYFKSIWWCTLSFERCHNFLTFSFHRHQLIVVYSFLPCPNYNVTNFIVK